MPVTSSGVTEGDKVLTSGITVVLPLLEGRIASLTWVTLPCLSFLKQARNSWSSHASSTFLFSLVAYRCVSNALHYSFEISKVTMMTFFGSISEDMSEEDRFG
jgi:hypothetical protein